MPKLTIEAADETAEIFIVASHFALRDRGVQRLEKELERGVYKVRAVSGRNEWQKVVALRQDTTVKIPRIEFGSAAPLAWTNRTHETHMDAAEGAAPPEPYQTDAPETAVRSFGRGQPLQHDSSLNFMARWWTERSAFRPRNLEDPGAGASLRTSGGRSLLKLAAIEDAPGDRVAPTNAGPRIAPEAKWFSGDLSGDRYSGTSLNAQAGLYTLALLDGDGTVEQTITLLTGWRTHVFALYEPPFDRFGQISDDGDKRLVDLSVHITRGTLSMHDDTARMTDAARFALADERSTATRELLQLVRGKFEAPMLGLYGAHLLLLLEDKQSSASIKRTVSYDADLFQEVVENSARIFGRDHPDIVALTVHAIDADPLRAPPMLRRSWSRLLTQSQGAPSLVPAPMWRRTALQSHTRPFFAWRTPQYGGTGTMLRDIRMTRAVLQSAAEAERLDVASAGLGDGSATAIARENFVRECINRFEVPRSVIDMIM
ncbi:MAG: hypothetical protein WA957_05270 [Alteraurantiacibacter sp.]